MAGKRRANNEGSVYYSPTQKFWRAQITLDGHRLSHCANSRQECQDWLKNTLGQIDTGLTYDAAQIKLRGFLEDWLVSIKSGLRPRSWSQYNMTVHRHILPPLGKFTLKDLRPDQIERFYDNKLKDGTGLRTIQYIHRTLYKGLSHAVKLGIIPRNPAENVTSPKPEYKEMKFYDETKANQLLQVVSGTRYEALYQLVLTTGIRQSELLALKWSDLDWRNKTITITRQLLRNGTEKMYFTSVKTKAGNRTIKLGIQTIQKMRAQLKFQNEERKALPRGDWKENDLIFPSLIGTPMNQSNLYKSFKNIIRKAGLPDIRFHDLRHTAASLMLNRGVPVIVVSKRLGHSRVSITLDVYGHLIPEMQNEAAQMIDDLITPIEIGLVPNCTPLENIENNLP